MTTTTLSSKSRFGSLLGGLMHKNRAAMLYIFVLSFFFFPLQYILETNRISREYVDGVSNAYTAFFNLFGPARIHTDLSMAMVFVIFMVAALVMSLSGAAYMQNRRAVDLYHSLPVSRGTLLTANAMSAFLTVALPMLLDYAIILVYGAFRYPAVLRITPATNYVYLPGAILMDCIGWLMTIAAIVSITMLVATQVCGVFENLMFTGEVLFAIPIIRFIIYGLSSMYLPGYCYEPSVSSMCCLSPVLVMLGKYVDLDNRAFYNIMILVWGLLTLGALLLARYFYARRPSEMAESVGRGGALAWFCKAFATLCGATLLGLLLGTLNNNSEGFFILGVAVGGALVCLLMEAILNRGFHGIGKALPIDAAMCAVYTILAVLLVTWGFGFSGRIPTAAAVEKVTISYRGRYDYCLLWDHEKEYKYDMSEPMYGHSNIDELTLSDPAAVETVLGLHKGMADCYTGGAESRDRGRSVHFVYTLKNGSTVERRFNRISEEALAALLALESQPDFYRQANPVFACPDENIARVYATGCTGLAIAESADKAEIAALLEALRADIAADSDPNDYSLPKAYLTFDTGIYLSETNDPLSRDSWNSFSISVPPEYTRTLAALAKLTGSDYSGYDFSAVNRIYASEYSYNDNVDNVYAASTRTATYYEMVTPDRLNQYDKEVAVESYEYGALIDEPEKIAELLSLAKKADGQADGQLHYLYLQLFQTGEDGTTAGATILLDYDSAPDWLLERVFDGYTEEERQKYSEYAHYYS